MELKFFCAFVLSKKFLIVTLLSLIILLFAPVSKAVTFTDDKVNINVHGTKVLDNSIIFVASYKSYSEKCTLGTCEIGQRFYPVTLYKMKSNLALTYAEYSAQHPYTGGNLDGPAKDAWNQENTEGYLKYLEENSKYSSIFNPGPSLGGEGCGSPGCIGGSIGSSRSYDVDIATGKYSQPLGQIFTTPIILLLTFLLIIIVICFFIKRKFFTQK